MRPKTNYVLNFWLISLTLALAKIIFTFRPELGLFTEEAQYWLWSKNMAWHYYSKPPLIAFFNWVSTAIFGVNEFAVRINAIILGIGAAWVVFKFTEYLYSSKRIAFWASMLMMSMPFWVLFSTFHLTDSELSFFWILSLFWIYRGIHEQSSRWWILGGLAAAFGLMAKSIMIVIGPFILIYLLLTKNFTAQWKNYVLFLLIGGIGFLPGFIWNWQNDFSTYKHLAHLSGVAAESGSFIWNVWLGRFGEYWGGQIAMLSIFLFPVLFVSIIRFLKNPDRQSTFLVLPALTSMVGFAGITLFTNVEANWPVFAYSTLPIFLSKWIIEHSERWLRLRNWGVAFGVGIPLVILFPDFLPFEKVDPMRKVEHATFRRLTGYKQISNRISFLRDSLEMNQALIISESYHMASELAFYLPEHPQTYAVNMGSRRNQFDLWEGLEYWTGKSHDGIFVSWNETSPNEVLTFDSLVYEEKLAVRLNGDSLRSATIQFWRNLKGFKSLERKSY